MRKNNFKFQLIATTLIGSISLFFQFTTFPPPSIVSAETAEGIPTRITIPKIHVDATIEQVFISSNGLIDAPKHELNTGWFRYGPKPGEEGNAIINGTVHWKYGSTAMFGDLHFLEVGNIIYIENDKGMTTSFVVREIKTFPLSENVSEIFLSDDNKSHLNLITTDGIWDKPSKSYSKRLVIFTDKEMSTTTPP